jgi:hypothetical protein
MTAERGDFVGERSERVQIEPAEHDLSSRYCIGIQYPEIEQKASKFVDEIEIEAIWTDAVASCPRKCTSGSVPRYRPSL